MILRSRRWPPLVPVARNRIAPRVKKKTRSSTPVETDRVRIAPVSWIRSSVRR